MLVDRALEGALEVVDRGGDDQQVVALVAPTGLGAHGHRRRAAAQQAGGLGLGGQQGGPGVALVVVVAAAGREGALAEAEAGGERGLVDRHPSRDQVAEGRGHPVDVAGPGEDGLVVEPPRSSSVNQPGAVPCSRHTHGATPAAPAATRTRRRWATSSASHRPGHGSSRAHSTVTRW